MGSRPVFFRTGRSPRRANLHKCGLAQSPSFDCGQRQTVNHVVDTCPLTEFKGGLNLLHDAYVDAVICLESTVSAALTHTRLMAPFPGLPR